LGLGRKVAVTTMKKRGRRRIVGVGVGVGIEVVTKSLKGTREVVECPLEIVLIRVV